MMKDSLNENKTLVILLGILALLILGALYYYILYPKIERSNQVADSIQRLSTEKSQLEQEIKSYYELDVEEVNTFALRKKLPETRAVSELLRSLEEVELVSGANIQSIAFNNYDGLVSESGYGLTDEESETGDSDIDEINRVQEERREKEGLDSEEEEDVPETKIDIDALPATLKLLSFSMQVDVQDYDHLLEFVKEIESLERIKRIEDISFSKGGEAELEVIDANESMTVTLQVTTFYSEEGAG